MDGAKWVNRIYKTEQNDINIFPKTFIGYCLAY